MSELTFESTGKFMEAEHGLIHYHEAGVGPVLLLHGSGPGDRRPGQVWRGKKMVPEAGLEPAHPCGREILSLLRLPISPLWHF